METIDESNVDVTERLKVSEVVDEPIDTEALLEERKGARKEEVASRIAKSHHGKAYYRSERQTNPNHLTRAYVRRNRDSRPRRRIELVTDEAIRVGGRVAIFEGSERIHVSVPLEDDLSMNSHPVCSRATVSGETVQEQLEVLDLADKILDIIEEAHG